MGLVLQYRGDVKHRATVGQNRNVSGPLDFSIGADDPTAPDVVALLRAHLDFAHEVTPPGHVHALDSLGLQSDDITFYGARDADGALVGVGALRDLGDGHFEIKSMHTDARVRGRGVGSAMVRYLLDAAASSEANRVSLETGTMDAFAPARELYQSFGFEICEPFGEYMPVPNSVCMTLYLD